MTKKKILLIEKFTIFISLLKPKLSSKKFSGAINLLYNSNVSNMNHWRGEDRKEFLIEKWLLVIIWRERNEEGEKIDLQHSCQRYAATMKINDEDSIENKSIINCN